MSNYVSGTSLKYRDYLQAKSFVNDVTEGSRAIQYEISEQTREIIATADELKASNYRIAEELEELADTTKAGFSELAEGVVNLTDVVADGMERISVEIQGVSRGIDILNSTFHWGFSEMIHAYPVG